MMKSEFIERTGYTPEIEYADETKFEIVFDEYDYIEEAYYEFGGDKDEFCAAWKKDFKSGAWAKELKFRKTIEAKTAKYEAEIAEKMEALEWYAKELNKGWEAQKKVKELEEKLARIQRIINQ